MKRSTLNFFIDLISFIVLTALAATGLIIKYILPPGTGGRGRQLTGGHGGEQIKELWSMSRHEWGDIHFYLAAAFVILMIIHIVLHFNWIKSYIKSLRQTL